MTVGPVVAAGPSAARTPVVVAPASRGRPMPAFLVVPALVAALVALAPFAYLLVRALEAGWPIVRDLVLRQRTLELLVNSVLLAVVVTALCVVLGVGVAWLVTRSDLAGRRGLGVAAALPLAVPTTVAAYAWLSVAPAVTGFGGAVLVLTVCSFPYVYLPVAASLRAADPGLEEAARALGSGPWTAFRRVTLRSLRPAIAGGALLVSLYVLSDFGAVSLLRYETFTYAIFQSYRASFDRTAAVVLALVLALLTLLIVWGEARTRGRARYARVGGGAARAVGPVRLGRLQGPVWLLVGGVLALALGVPATALGYWLVQGRSEVVGLAEVLPAVGSSVLLSVGGAALTLALALPVGLLAARWPQRRLVRAVEGATYVGHALPGIVVALSLVFLSVRLWPAIYQTAWLVVLAYAVLFLPLAVAAVRASALQAPPALEEVARSLGRRPREVLRTVTLPLVAPGIAAGAGLVFLTCMKELPATLLLRPTGMETLATELWTETAAGAFAAAAPYAALLVLVSAVPAVLVSRRAL